MSEPITPGELECCSPCMELVHRHALTGRKLQFAELRVVHAVLHRNPHRSAVSGEPT